MNPTGPIRAVAVTRAGAALIERLPYRRHRGELARVLQEHWQDSAGFVLVAALGAVVRIVAPLLQDKERDPAIVVLDEQGRFCVPVLGGHAAGANRLAREVAGLLGAQPVITTASDTAGWPALDDLPGWVAHGPLARAQRAALDGAPIHLDRRLAWPLPGPWDTPRPGVAAEGALAPPVLVQVDDQRCPGCLPAEGLESSPPASPSPDRVSVVLHPPSLVVGLGCELQATPEQVRAAIHLALDSAGLSPASVSHLASIDRRAQHPALATQGWPLATYPAELLSQVPVAHPSPVVAQAVGTPSVAEAAALLAAGPDACLVVPKRVLGPVTVAVARRPRPPGQLTLVGLGPGTADLRTPRATAALLDAEVVVGYEPYLELCQDTRRAGQDWRPYPIGEELERARDALETARAGRRVALVCSGDPGVFAMASPVLELADDPRYSDLSIQVEPGLSAALVAAARLGAPLGHDFCCLSLSDLLTPWEQIEARLEAAGRADLVVVLYNPRSARRRWQLPRAAQVLARFRPPDTPVGIATDLGRPGEQVQVVQLADLLDPQGTVTDRVTMTTLVLVGASTTRRHGDRLVTPRGYPARPANGFAPLPVPAPHGRGAS